MKTLTLTLASVMVFVLFSGCDGNDDGTPSTDPAVEDSKALPISLVLYLRKKIPIDEAGTIKPLQIITNEKELQALYNKLPVNLGQDINFSKDIVIVMKRFSNASYGDDLRLANDGNQSIEIQSMSAEITVENEEANASISVVHVVNAFHKPIYLIKETSLMDQATRDLRKIMGSYAVNPMGPSSVEMAYVTSHDSRHHLMPQRITDTAYLETYAATYDFNISQLRYNNEPFVEGNIMSSGYYVSPDSTASFDKPVLSMISQGDTIYIAAEDDWMPNYHFYFKINGIRNDCVESYANAKEALFYRFDPVVNSSYTSYYTAQQSIVEKSCTNLRTANLEELGDWISKKTWQAEQ